MKFLLTLICDPSAAYSLARFICGDLNASENLNVYRWVRPATVGWTPKLTIG